MKGIIRYPWFWTALLAYLAYFDVRSLNGGWVYDDAGSVIKNVVVNGMARRILGLVISGLTKERMSGSLFRDNKDRSVEAGFQPYRQWAKPCRPWEVDPGPGLLELSRLG